jgi:anti-sigma B factor antagonist|tara:strand:- start:195 stop:548 length:354 start_codon:yes stop_codon:yes gene_type:complete
MSIDWSAEIAIANLADEPALSDELSSMIEQIEQVKDPKDAPHIVLDFHEVSYVNSSNIAQLLRIRKLLESTGHRLVLCSVTDEVMSVLIVSGLNKIFSFAPDTLTAIASVQIEDSPA